MGLFQKLFGPQRKTTEALNQYFRTLTAYNPRFIDYAGGIYEMDATRAAIHAIATHCSKLKPELVGPGSRKRLERMLQIRPNPWMTTSQFLYRLATILETENTAFIIPMLDEYGKIKGLFPAIPREAELVQDEYGTPFLRFRFRAGEWAAMEWELVGVMTKMQFESDVFGENNSALQPTMNLLSAQSQGIANGIKQAAAIRFLARLGNSVRPEVLKEEQRRFRELNLLPENSGGVMIIDTKYAEVKQLDSKPYVADADTMKIIMDNVSNYFGVNEKILRNEWDEAAWNAFYEGKVEPFALQLSLVLTGMLFTEKEIAFGNEVQFTANRLQFATIDNKVRVITQLFDRGLISFNEGREILQMAPIEGGDRRMIRGEYVSSDERSKDGNSEGPKPMKPALPEPEDEEGDEDAGET